MIGHKIEGGHVAPLHVVTHTICPPDQALANVRHALSLPYPVFKLRETVSICGSGPSLGETYGKVVGDVMACNTAIQFLDDRGVRVHSAMMFDAHPKMVAFARRIEGCRYYLASRCAPELFAALDGMDIVVWHALGDAGLVEMLEGLHLPPEKHGECIMGGSAAVTRSLYLARAIGYTDIHLFGADSSRLDDRTHVLPSISEEDQIEVFALGRSFRTTRWMAQQAKEFQVIAPIIEATGAKITVHGDGLLPHIWKWMKDAA